MYYIYLYIFVHYINMIQTKNIYETKPSSFGEKYEKIKFYNNKWYDVKKNSYILAKFYEKGNWYIIDKNSDYLKI